MSNPNCPNCTFKARYDRNPKSLPGRIWRWHISLRIARKNQFLPYPSRTALLIHQFREIVRAGADIINELFLVGNCLSDIVLTGPVIRVPEPGIDDAVLDVDQKRFLAKILVLGYLQQADEFLRPGGARLDVLDFK